MNQGKTAVENPAAFREWCFNETVEIEHNRKTLSEERMQFEAEKREFERIQLEYLRRKEIEEKRLEQERSLVEMKLRILEEELQGLASEKKKLERQKAFYSKVQEYEQQSQKSYEDYEDVGYSNVVSGEMFFTGVASKQSLKKRYKDLIKIYHPDNLNGDTDTIQEINREFDELCKVFG